MTAECKEVTQEASEVFKKFSAQLEALSKDVNKKCQLTIEQCEERECREMKESLPTHTTSHKALRCT